MTAKLVVPKDLGPGGRELWAEITASYVLRASERRVLADACREADLVDDLEAARKDAPLMVKGSMGQLVASPLISELRQHRAALNALLKSLKSPLVDESASSAKVASESARAAARARWDRKSA